MRAWCPTVIWHLLPGEDPPRGGGVADSTAVPAAARPHPQGTVIGAGVVGPRAWIFQDVTIGAAPGKVGVPSIGADPRSFSGAVVAGPIALGDNVEIGATAVVHGDGPDRTLVRCPPAEFAPLPERFRVD